MSDSRSAGSVVDMSVDGELRRTGERHGCRGHAKSTMTFFNHPNAELPDGQS